MTPELARFADLGLRVVVGTALGAVIGYERDVHGRPAGLRTHALVALGAATFMVVSTHFVFFQHYGRDDLVAIDTSRIAASVVSGIGFLAGGAILRTGLTVQGLTTAAGLWVVAAIGLAAGGGMYAIAVLTTVVAVLALTMLRRFEDKHMVRWNLALTLDGASGDLTAVVASLRAQGALTSDTEYERDAGSDAVTAVLDVRAPASLASAQIAEAVRRLPGTRRVSLKRPL